MSFTREAFAVTSSNPNQRNAAHRLRRRAKRYRTLAVTNGDEQDVATMKTISREIDDEAAQIEQELAE
jgi:hypothetical protein